MVKRKSIGRKPEKLNADDFVNAGADAELTSVEKSKGKIHRISLDVDSELYRALKIAALDAEKPMVQLIREILSEHVNT